MTQSNWPLPRNNIETKFQGAFQSSFIVFLMIVGLALIPTSISVFVVKEKETGAKECQFVAGVSPFA